MGRLDRISLIEHLLLCALDAHTLYQERVLHGECDMKWAEWYAEYLIGHGLDNLIGDQLEVEEIAAFFEDIEKEIPAKPTETPWMHFAAAKIARLREQSAS